MTDNVLLQNLNKLHSTPGGIKRIKRNLDIDTDDVVGWCRQRIVLKDAVITRKGKNWYVEALNAVITINAYSYTIITAHWQKNVRLKNN